MPSTRLWPEPALSRTGRSPAASAGVGEGPIHARKVSLSIAPSSTQSALSPLRGSGGATVVCRDLHSARPGASCPHCAYPLRGLIDEAAGVGSLASRDAPWLSGVSRSPGRVERVPPC
jgi:hypothetical protein